MAPRLYTEGEAVSLAGKILARGVELCGRLFFLLAQFFAAICRVIFTGVGLCLDGCQALHKTTADQMHPELRATLEDAVQEALKASVSADGWQWVDEAILPIRQILAVTQNAFREKSLKRDAILEKDYRALVMAKILKEIIMEAAVSRWLMSPTLPMGLAPADAQGSAAAQRPGEPNGFPQEPPQKLAGHLRTVIDRRLAKQLLALRLVTLRCPDDPLGKAELMLKSCIASFRYHRTGNRKYRKRLLRLTECLRT